MHPDNLISLKDDMIAFIAGHGMRRLPGFISEDLPAVTFEDDGPDAWKDFVEHAKAANAPFVIMNEVVLQKQDLALLLEHLNDESFPPAIVEEIEDAQYLVNHVGKIGYLQLGFAHQGVMFVFETATEWYDTFQDLMDIVTGMSGMMVDDNYTEDE
ncbi:hypothetical protein GCM10011507_05370 [Edaphobacter acidisoli]|uniref:Uncharacterized protein n=2 Tax=Edaphobacter acidisoli TaxID=2040573 RepID=A0A916RK64_9BACT|nr:hypothetical protein [Edaphobacter acidisoli]GGA56967.1 hypothetical protein GCM10011507_05370 [Edaphobacter acidisoli]